MFKRQTALKYLKQYAEPEAFAFYQAPLIKILPNCAHVLVVPVYDEQLSALQQLVACPNRRSDCFIWVFNAPEGGDAEAHQRTQFLFQRCSSWLESVVSACLISDNLHLFRFDSGRSILLINRCLDTNLLPAKQGVGLARKIGLDCAFALACQQMESGQEPPEWFLNTDADVSLPDRYFDLQKPSNGQVAAIYPVRHVPEPGLELAMALYDFKLDYYQAMLAQAGSPYAFQTIGSAIAVTPGAYLAVRGMPKRAAGEDFYLLNKLAKQGDVFSLASPTIQVAGRLSERVPFGTGPALSEIISYATPLDEYLFYSPVIFERLERVLKLVQRIDSIPSLQLFQHELGVSMGKPDFECVWDALLELGLEKFFQHLHAQSHRQAFPVLFHHWFDGFLTLKFVHAMRARDCPSIALHSLRTHSSLLSPVLIARINALLG